jgi:hypothetical protein
VCVTGKESKGSKSARSKDSKHPKSSRQHASRYENESYLSFTSLFHMLNEYCKAEVFVYCTDIHKQYLPQYTSIS